MRLETRLHSIGRVDPPDRHLTWLKGSVTEDEAPCWTEPVGLARGGYVPIHWRGRVSEGARENTLKSCQKVTGIARSPLRGARPLVV